ncbi:MAG TPA: DUF1801 domain-containing protein [Candidatus Dormibacteraeota bacterium]|nr:DUF1801 domain-containing protein [Candidatus Dormibacteraeota bacterium]
MAPARRSTSTSPKAKFAASPEAYIASAPKAAQPHLRQLRSLIRQLAPKADERISYGIVGYFYPTRMIYFGGHAKHVALYPAGDAKGLEKYLYGASTLRFPLDEPLPIAKIRSLVRSRVKAYEAAAKGKRGAAAARGYGTARSKR